MQKNNTYRFFIFWWEIPAGIKIREVFPVNTSELKINYVNKYNQRFLIRELSGEVKLINDFSNGITDFNFIKSIEAEEDGYPGKCETLYFGIDKFCNNRWMVNPDITYPKGILPDFYWTGSFAVIDGRFDNDRCVYSFTPIAYNEYNCIEKILKAEYNIINTHPTKVMAPVVDGWGTDICGPANVPILGKWDSFANCFTPYSTNFQPNAYLDCQSTQVTVNHKTEDWQIWRQYYKKEPPDTSAAGQEKLQNHTVTTIWVRWYKVTLNDNSGNPVPPPVGTWNYRAYTTLNGLPASTWTRDISEWPAKKWNRINIVGCKSYYYEAEFDAPDVIGSMPDEFKTGRKIEDIINDIISPCNMIFYSIFFSTDINYVTNKINQLKYLTLHPKVDILNPTAIEPATVAKITLERLLEILGDMFNGFWYVEKPGAPSGVLILRFEHWSFFSMANGIDAIGDYPEYMKSHNKYKYDKSNMPKYERWKFMEARNVDFVGEDIYYDSPCVDRDNVKERNLSDITTDLQFIRNFPGQISNSGFVMLANSAPSGPSGTLLTISDVGMISKDTIINAPLSLANLHHNYWRHGRVIISGYMNGSLQTFLSVEKRKILDSIRLPICCNEFDTNKLINTDLGWGEVSEATEYLKTGIFEIILKYE